jgi:hypothetical protein
VTQLLSSIEQMLSVSRTSVIVTDHPASAITEDQLL